MFSLRITATIIGLAITALFVFQAIAQHPAVITRSIDRSSTPYHQMGYRVFRPAVLRSMGGVLSQANQLVDQAGNQVKVQVELVSNDIYPGYFMVRQAGMRGSYPIEYDDLVPMVLFVDGGGTSLYTIWEDEDDRLPPEFQSEAGFVKYSDAGHVALEFARTRYADALLFADTCLGCAGLPDKRLGSEISANIPKIKYETSSSSSINTDVALPFRINVRDNRIIVEGGIVRLHWEIVSDSGKLVINEARPLVRPNRLPQQVRQKIDEIDNSIDKISRQPEPLLGLLILAQIRKEVQKEANEAARRKLGDAFFLFETLALLRTAKETEPERWSTFVQALKSEELVRANLGPWMRYTQSFCSVHPEDPECAELGTAHATIP